MDRRPKQQVCICFVLKVFFQVDRQCFGVFEIDLDNAHGFKVFNLLERRLVWLGFLTNVALQEQASRLAKWTKPAVVAGCVS